MSNRTRVYVSSTFADLKDCRAAVNEALRKAGYELVAMEDYPAFDQRPLAKCLADVASCDIYIGILAWRYGFVPEKDNPERKSITHREYEQARESNIPRLMFLLDPEAPWQRNQMDDASGEGERGELIKRFRDEVGKEHGVGFLQSPDDLAKQVISAITAKLNELERGESRRQEAKAASAQSWSWPKPLDFRPFVESKRKGFVGRDWLCSEDEWLAGEGSNAITLRPEHRANSLMN